MRPSDSALLASLAEVSRHACLRRLAHRRGNRYIIWVLGSQARRAA